MSKKLYTIRMGVMRTFDIVRKTGKGWYVKSKGVSDVYIARNNKTVRVAASKGDLSYYEYNHVTVNRGEAKAVCAEQLARYARHCRIDMMNKFNRPIIDVVEITRTLEANNAVNVNIYHENFDGICITCNEFGKNYKSGISVKYTGDAIKFETELEHYLEQLIGKLKNG